jgi:hypothetical protein
MPQVVAVQWQDTSEPWGWETVALFDDPAVAWEYYDRLAEARRVEDLQELPLRVALLDVQDSQESLPIYWWGKEFGVRVLTRQNGGKE